jgi:hypothetical protein
MKNVWNNTIKIYLFGTSKKFSKYWFSMSWVRLAELSLGYVRMSQVSLGWVRFKPSLRTRAFRRQHPLGERKPV